MALTQTSDNEFTNERTSLLHDSDEENDYKAKSQPIKSVTSSCSELYDSVTVEEALVDSSNCTRPSSRSHSSSRTTPIPWKPVLALMLITAIQPLAFELVMPFVNQMILENGIVDNPEDVGFYSGLIESVFAFMSFLAVMPCSYLSDHYGRKPVILIGTCGLALSTALFGMSKTFVGMVATRCLGGALGGVWSASRVMAGEITDKTNQAAVFSTLSIAYRIGQSLGQPLGGLLSHPERHIPLPVFKQPFWLSYPFSLPCFVAAAIALITVGVGWISIQETLPAKMRKRRTRDSVTYGSVSDSAITDSFTEDAQKSARPSVWSVLTPYVCSVMFSNATAVFVSECVFVVYPLFAFTPIHLGGLGLSEAMIGVHMALRATSNIMVTLFYPRIERRLGTVKAYQLSMWLWPLIVLGFPVLNSMARSGWGDGWAMWAMLWAFWILWSFGCLIWSGIGIMVNNAAPSEEALAVMNGIAQMSIVLPQAFAPALVTSTFAWSINLNVFGGNTVWIILGILTSAAATHTLSLKEPAYDWRDERDSPVTHEST